MRASLFVLVTACGSAPGPTADYLAADWYPDLAPYGMVGIDGGKMKAADDDVLTYDVATPLFTDYAEKFRTVWIPPGSHIVYRSEGPLEFPIGTIVTKSFGFGGRWIETRLLVRRDVGWDATTYVWDETQKSALHRPGGTTTTGATSADTYVVPSSTQCGKCHEQDGGIAPIGLTALQIDHDVLQRWAKDDKLLGLPESIPALPRFGDASLPVETRARAYLHANCAHCHSEGGEARTTGLFLGIGETDPLRLGVCKAPVAAGMASAGLDDDIVPGDPENSILIHRMASTTPSVMMPEVGRTQAHTEAVALISDWIRAMPSAPCR